MRASRWGILCISAFVVLVLFFSVASVNAATPAEFMRETVDGVKKILEEKTLSEESDYDRLSSFLLPRFDIKAMADRVLGTYQPTSYEHDKFVEVFGGYLEIQFLNLLMSERGKVRDAKFEFSEGKVDSTGTFAEVQGAMTTSKDTYKLSVKLRMLGDRWVVSDVFVDGISYVSNNAAQISAVIKKHSFSTLLFMMEDKIAQSHNHQKDRR